MFGSICDYSISTSFNPKAIYLAGVKKLCLHQYDSYYLSLELLHQISILVLVVDLGCVTSPGVSSGHCHGILYPLNYSCLLMIPSYHSYIINSIQRQNHLKWGWECVRGRKKPNQVIFCSSVVQAEGCHIAFRISVISRNMRFFFYFKPCLFPYAAHLI